MLMGQGTGAGMGRQLLVFRLPGVGPGFGLLWVYRDWQVSGCNGVYGYESAELQWRVGCVTECATYEYPQIRHFRWLAPSYEMAIHPAAFRSLITFITKKSLDPGSVQNNA